MNEKMEDSAARETNWILHIVDSPTILIEFYRFQSQRLHSENTLNQFLSIYYNHQAEDESGQEMGL